jgi:hypothetical protein
LANGRRPNETKHKPRKSSPVDSFFIVASRKNQYIDKSEKMPFSRIIFKVLEKGLLTYQSIQ